VSLGEEGILAISTLFREATKCRIIPELPVDFLLEE